MEVTVNSIAPPAIAIPVCDVTPDVTMEDVCSNVFTEETVNVIMMRSFENIVFE